MDRAAIESKLAKSIGYDRENAVLAVEFHNGGVYEYPGVTPEEHAELMAAKSIGSHFLKVIKPKYRGSKAQAESQEK